MNVALAFLGLIAVRRGGWRDFRIVLRLVSGESWGEFQFAQLRRLFRVLVRQRGPLGWDLNHGQMRKATLRQASRSR